METKRKTRQKRKHILLETNKTIQAKTTTITEYEVMMNVRNYIKEKKQNNKRRNLNCCKNDRFLRL